MIYLASYEPGSTLENRDIEHRIGRRLLRFGLEKEYGRTWEVKEGEGVKPFLWEAPGICFNISHTRGVVVCAISALEVGVDVEVVSPFRDSLMKRVCSPGEQEFVKDGFGRGGSGAKDVCSGDCAGVVDGFYGGCEGTADGCCAGTGSGEGGGEPVYLSWESRERFFRLWTLKESFIKATGQGLKFPLRDITFSWEQGNKIKGSIPGYHFYQSVVYGKYIISVCEADRKQEGERI